jgi:hypothetical protein
MDVIQSKYDMLAVRMQNTISFWRSLGFVSCFLCRGVHLLYRGLAMTSSTDVRHIDDVTCKSSILTRIVFFTGSWRHRNCPKNAKEETKDTLQYGKHNLTRFIFF